MANDVALYRGGGLHSTYDTATLAVAASQADDVVRVGETDSPYFESVDLNGLSKITLEAKSGESPVITGAIAALAAANSEWTSYGAVSGRAAYYTSYSHSVNRVTAVQASNQMRLWTYGTWSDFASFHAGEGVYLDTANNRLYLWLYEDANPNNIPLWISKEDYVVRLYNSSECNVGDGLTFRVGGESVVQLRYDSHSNEIADCIIQYGHRGIHFKYATGHNNQHGNIVDNCEIHDSYRRHYWNWHDVKSSSHNPRQMEHNGISLDTGGTGIEIKNCDIRGWFDGVSIGTEYSGTPYLDGMKFHGNTIHDIRDDAINLEWYHRNTEIYDNLVYDAYIGFAVMPCPHGPVYIYRNRFITDRILYYEAPDDYVCGRGTKIGEYGGAHDSEDVYVYHNSFWSRYDCVAIEAATPPLRDEWYNNIFYTTRQGYTFNQITRQIAASTDDAEESGAGVMDLTSPDLDLASYKAGARFTNIAIPQGADIVSAKLVLTARYDESAGGRTRIYGEKVANAGTFTSGNNDITNRPTTTAFRYVQFGAWTAAGTYSYNVTDVVQELIDQGTWSSGNALALLLLNNAGTEHSAISHDLTPGDSPELVIEWLQSEGSASGRCVSGTGLATDGNEFDHNLYYGAGSGTKIRNWNHTPGANTSYASLALAKASADGVAAGWEGDGVEGDPVWDETTYPYPLTIGSGSPARNAGRTLPIGWPDSVALSDTPDIGYYEYSAELPAIILATYLPDRSWPDYAWPLDYWPKPESTKAAMLGQSCAGHVVVYSPFGVSLAEIVPDLRSVTWRLNGIGAASFNLSWSDPKCTRDNLKYWNRILIRFPEEYGFPDWGGVIDTPRRVATGVVGVKAYTGEHIFEARRTGRNVSFESATPGYIVQQLLLEENDEWPTGIVEGSIFLGGDARGKTLHYHELWYKIREIAKQSGMDFVVSPVLNSGILTFELDWYQRRGSDKRDSVLLLDGANVVDGVLDEQGKIANSIKLAGGGSGWSNRIYAEVEDGGSIDSYGFHEWGQVQSGVTVQDTLDINAAEELDGRKAPKKRFSLIVKNCGPSPFADYDVGDIVAVKLFVDSAEWYEEAVVRIIGRTFFATEEKCRLEVQEWHD